MAYQHQPLWGNQKPYIFVRCVVEYVGIVWGFWDEVCSANPQTWIMWEGRWDLILQTKICIHAYNQGIQKPVISYIHQHLKHCLTYWNPGGAFSHLTGKLMLRHGYEGQRTASSPGTILAMPPSTCAQPPHFNIFRWAHCNFICINILIRDFETSTPVLTEVFSKVR